MRSLRSCALVHLSMSIMSSLEVLVIAVSRQKFCLHPDWCFANNLLLAMCLNKAFADKHVFANRISVVLQF